MSPSDLAVLFTPDPVTASAEFKVLLAKTGEQMIGSPAESLAGATEVVTLGADDVPAMMELTNSRTPARSRRERTNWGRFLESETMDNWLRWRESA